jgi:hypothetical protein
MPITPVNSPGGVSSGEWFRTPRRHLWRALRRSGRACSPIASTYKKVLRHTPAWWCLFAWLPHTTARRASTTRCTGSCWTRIKVMTCLRANRQPKRPHTPQRWGGSRATAALEGLPRRQEATFFQFDWLRQYRPLLAVVVVSIVAPRLSTGSPSFRSVPWLWRCSCSSAHRPWSSGSQPSSMGASPEPVDERPVLAHGHSGARCQRLKGQRHQHLRLAPGSDSDSHFEARIGGGLCRLIPCF